MIFDELHAQPNRELWDVLTTTSMGARRQPMLVAITTPGYDRESVCWEQHEYARQVTSGVIDDPAFFGYIRGSSEETDDWQDPATWSKANPGFDKTIKLDYLETKHTRRRCRRIRTRFGGSTSTSGPSKKHGGSIFRPGISAARR